MADAPKDPKPLRKIVYPFPKTDARDPAQPKQVEVKDADDYFKALSQAQDGFYPIGYNGQWHGGVHFGAETKTALAQDDGIRCIADGEVIAYRIDGDAYPTAEYKTCAAATYSKGFVLVRHRLQPPPAPKTAQAGTTTTTDSTAANTSTQPQAEPSLVFYSLYMHLQYWKAYQDDTKQKRPAFWDDMVYLAADRAVDSDRAKNSFIPELGGIGMNLRDANNAIAGFAPRGVKLKLGEANPAKNTQFRITEVVAGTTYPDNIVGLYAYKGTASSKEGLEPVGTPRKKDGTVYVLPEPIEIRAGDLIGHLGQYQRYSDMNPLTTTCTERPLVQLDVFAGEDLKDFIEKSQARDAQLDAKQKTLLHIQPAAQLVQAAEADIDIPAGDAAIFVGGNAADRWVKGRQGTLSVGANPGGFNTGTRAYGNGAIFVSAVNPTDGSELGLDAFNALTSAQKQPYTQRKVLTPASGDIWLDRNAANTLNIVAGPVRVWSEFPLQVANAAGDAIAHSRITPLKSAEATVREADGTRWFQVEAGTSNGTVQGWAREKDHANVVLCSPWAWPGFVLLDTGAVQPKDLYGRALEQTGQTQPDERGQMESLSQSAERSPLFDALCKAIDADGKDGITPLELRSALGKPWLAQALSRLAISHHSEWAGPMTRWNAIDKLIPEQRKEDWTQEKLRIESLQLWDDVKGQNGFPENPKVHHLHPVGFVDNFITGRDTTTYRVHQNGLIEKLASSRTTEESIRNAHYIYVDAQGNDHDFGVFEGTRATRWIRKNSLGTEKIYLMNASELGANPARQFGFRFTGTQRRYLSQSALASLIGALMDTGYDDVTSTGFSMQDGTPGVSSSHINGENGDFRFLRIDENPNTQTYLNTVAGVNALDEARQGSFNNALHKFGWTSQLAWRYTKDGEQRLLPMTIHYADHHHHLHVGGYTPNLVEIEQ